MADSLKSEYDRQIRVVKEDAKEKMVRVVSERDKAMKVLEEGKAELKVNEE